MSYFCSFDHIKRSNGGKIQADHHICSDKPPAEPDDQNSNMITVYQTEQIPGSDLTDVLSLGSVPSSSHLKTVV